MKKPVLFRVTNNLNLGGIQRRLRAVLPRLLDDFEVHVATYREKGVLFDELAGLGVRTTFVEVRKKWNPVGLNVLARTFREQGADIVHTHSLGGNVTGILAAAMARVPVRIGNVHRRDRHWYGKNRLHRWKQVFEEKWIHRFFTDRILFVSQESLDFFQKKTGLPDNKLMLLHNGLDFSAMRPARSRHEVRAEFNIPDHKEIVGFVGRFESGKGLKFFLDAAVDIAARSGDYFFLVVGGGGGVDTAELQREYEQRGLKGSLAFAGLRQDVYDFFGAFECFFFPSEPHWEGMPGVVLEAASFGLPILSRETDPVREITKQYPRIHIMRDSDDPLRALQAAQSLPVASQKTFRAEYSLEAMVERTKQLYFDLLKEKRDKK